MMRRRGCQDGERAGAGRLLTALRLAVLAAMLAGAAGCETPTHRRVMLDSPDPVERVRGCLLAARDSDASAIHKLVELLEDTDAAVRMSANQALTEMTGKNFGYRHYAPAEARLAAVERWRAALRAGEVSMLPKDQPDAAARLPGSDCTPSSESGDSPKGAP